jgi:hypothetical protein
MGAASIPITAAEVTRANMSPAHCERDASADAARKRGFAAPSSAERRPGVLRLVRRGRRSSASQN